MIKRTHHRFSVDDYEQMISNGILTENDRVELIEGEIIDKMPVGPIHAAVVKRLNRWASQALAADCIVSVQDPIVMADSEPEPDLALLKHRSDFYSQAKPSASDVYLLVEVSDTTLEYDKDVKLPLYARSGVEEYWIVNLNEMLVEVYRGPRSDGSYGDCQKLTVGDTLSLQRFSDVTLAVEQVLVGS